MLRVKPNTLWDALSAFYLSVRPSFRLSVLPYASYMAGLAPKSMHAETQSRRNVARSGSFFDYIGHNFPTQDKKLTVAFGIPHAENPNLVHNHVIFL